jgi:hypothetical protein
MHLCNVNPSIASPLNDRTLKSSRLADVGLARCSRECRFDAALAREPRGGLIVTQDVFNLVHRASIIALAAQYRVPTIYPFKM